MYLLHEGQFPRETRLYLHDFFVDNNLCSFKAKCQVSKANWSTKTSYWRWLLPSLISGPTCHQWTIFIHISQYNRCFFYPVYYLEYFYTPYSPVLIMEAVYFTHGSLNLYRTKISHTRRNCEGNISRIHTGLGEGKCCVVLNLNLFNEMKSMHKKCWFQVYVSGYKTLMQETHIHWLRR
jgi:hypothetical protein